MKKNLQKINIESDETLLVSRKIIAVLSKHIGKNNAISKRNLFKHFFGEPENYNQYQQLYMWSRLLSMISYIRRTTKCFVVSEQRVSGYYFYVLKSDADANVYIKQANDKINGLKNMQRIAKKAAKEKWYLKVVEAGKKYKLNNNSSLKLIGRK